MKNDGLSNRKLKRRKRLPREPREDVLKLVDDLESRRKEENMPLEVASTYSGVSVKTYTRWTKHIQLPQRRHRESMAQLAYIGYLFRFWEFWK